MWNRRNSRWRLSDVLFSKERTSLRATEEDANLRYINAAPLSEGEEIHEQQGFHNQVEMWIFQPLRTRSIDWECGFTVVIGYIDLLTVVCVNVLVALNTATNSVTKGDRVVRNFALLQGVCLLACFLLNFFYKMGRVSVDGIATGYGLRGREIESRCERYFLHRSRWAPGPPRLLYNGYRVIHEGKRLGSIINHLPHLGTRVKKV